MYVPQDYFIMGLIFIVIILYLYSKTEKTTGYIKRDRDYKSNNSDRLNINDRKQRYNREQELFNSNVDKDSRHDSGRPFERDERIDKRQETLDRLAREKEEQNRRRIEEMKRNRTNN